MSSNLVVVKVGGSLFDLPDLGPRLLSWLDALPNSTLLLVPGGGAMADVIRDLDRCHRLGEERSHWLALQAMVVNAHFLAALLPGCRVVPAVEAGGGLQVLDAFRFALADERRPDHLPHRWSVTSDTVAARAALVFGARELILLKSIDMAPEMDWREAGRRGFVDGSFAEVVGTRLKVRAVNLRSQAAS